MMKIQLSPKTIMMSPIPIILFVLLIACSAAPESHKHSSPENSAGPDSLVSAQGKTVESRFSPPEGFKRVPADSGSFAFFLRHLPLKPPGTKVRYYDGTVKEESVYEAVVDMEITNKNLQQCADAVMRLRGEYFYSIGAYDSISFTLTNGFRVDYSEWMKGKRVVVNGNTTTWKQTEKPSNTYADFRAYMDFVFTYAGTLSLSKTLHPKAIKDIACGDVFIYGGSPGHAVIVVDVAQNKSGEKVFLLAQSYMPAQETQILKNPSCPEWSPWYSNAITGKLETPEWTFEATALKSW
jgi:hypothetical protein